LGTDQIRVLSFDSKKLFTVEEDLTINTKKGSGPRHLTFHPNGKFAYCIEEISGTVSTYKYDNGRLERIDRDPSYERLQDDHSSADIHISPDGRHLYASNRQEENSLSIFSINQSDGTISVIGHQSTHGTIPRSFVIDPSGEFLLVANRTSNQIIVFKRDSKTGLLTKKKEVINVSQPSSLKMRTYRN
jgi:6-phosphogluconolactonase